MTLEYRREQFGAPVPSGFAEPLHEFARNMLLLRKWEKDHIPLLAPQIALDILLYSAASTGVREPVPTKEFHLVIGHSKDRVREVMRELTDQGLIRYLPDIRDARVKRISLTDAGLQLIEQYRSSYLDKLRNSKQ